MSSPRPAWRRHRPAPRNAPGPATKLTDTVVWDRLVEPREKYRIQYSGSDGSMSWREIELLKLGHSGGSRYAGVNHAGRFKTMRLDRITAVEQLSAAHAPSLRPYPTYAMMLPEFPVKAAIYKVPTVAAGNRSWTVDLNRYTCTCPEKRIRLGLGYDPGRLGHVCPHMARAILDHLPAGSPGWDAELLTFLEDPRKVHIDNLS